MVSRARCGPVSSHVAAERVIAHLRQLVATGALRPGDRLPTQRVLASRLGVSLPSAREGLRLLETLGIVASRGGAGTFISTGRPTLAGEPLALLAALHQFDAKGMSEARQVLEPSAAALAAKRATGTQMAVMSHEIAEMFAALGDAEAFLAHHARFHCAVAAATNNPVLGGFIEAALSLQGALSGAISAATPPRLREAADQHRRIYQAIRSRDARAAREAMEEEVRREHAPGPREAVGGALNAGRRAGLRPLGCRPRGRPSVGLCLRRSRPPSG